MKTFTVTGYQPWGTTCASAYKIRVSYRGEPLAEFSGPDAAERALRYVARHAGRAVISMGDK